MTGGCQMSEPLMTRMRVETAEDLPLSIALSYQPKPSELSDHASRWAQWGGHDEHTADAYGAWYATEHVDQPWSACTPHKTAFRRFGDFVEDRERHNLHPSRFTERTLSL